jgi:hypothetical protein
MAVTMQRGDDCSLGFDSHARWWVVEFGEDCPRCLIASAALQGERSLARGGENLVRR